MRDFRGLLKLAQTNTPMAAAPGVTTPVVKPAPTASRPPIAKPVVQNATNFDTFTDDQKTLAKLLYDEARGHTADMPYIAAAVYNRSLGTDHVGEVIQPVTFSGMGLDRSFKSWSHRNDNDAEKAAWQEAMKQAMAIYADDYVPPTSATHFALPNAVASWNNGKTMLPISGVAHRFYDDVRFERPWVATPMPVLTAQNMRKHKVAPGENFSKIAQKYGVPTSWIQAWNAKVDPKKLKVGSEILYVPLPAGYISSSATGKQAAEELKERREQRLKNSIMNKGAMAYMVGFMSKCAESLSTPYSNSDFSRIVDAYRDRYGIDLSHMRMRWSKHPVYNNGRRSYDFDDDETGGSWVNDGTVRINPKLGPVLKRFGIEGMTQAEFRRRIIAHELAHEVWHNQARKKRIKKLILNSLRQAREENFTTPYLDTYPADTPKRKFDSELFAEYMSDQLNKPASVTASFPKSETDSLTGVAASLSKTANWYYKGLRNLNRRLGVPLTKETASKLFDKYKFFNHFAETARAAMARSGSSKVKDYSNFSTKQLLDEIYAVLGEHNVKRYYSKRDLIRLFRLIRENPTDDIRYLARRGHGSMPFALSYGLQDPIGEFSSGKQLASTLKKVGPDNFKEVSLKDFAKQYGTDFIFKGNGSIATSEQIANKTNRNNQWWTRNPFVAAGYSGDLGGQILLIPNRGQVRRLVHSRATPHIATDEIEKIVDANIRSKKGIPVVTQFTDTPASRAADYEVVLNSDFWKRHRKTAFPVFSLVRPHDPSGKGNFPVFHGLSDIGMKDMLGDSFIVPDAKARKILAQIDLGPTSNRVFKKKVLGRFLEPWNYKQAESTEEKASDAKYSLKADPTYEDVLKVFNKLDSDDRANLVPRHPDFLCDVPADMLFDRQVAIDSDGNPVGFNEFYYGRNKLGRRQPPHNSIAVVPEARGNGLARLMVEEAIRKARKEKIKRLVWEAFSNNDGSIHAALSSGFEDATPKNAKTYRRFVYDVTGEPVEKKASSLDLKKLFPNSKFPTKEELKKKERSFSVGDRVKVSDHIRCLQKGHVGTIVRIDPEDKYGWKSFVVEFDDKKCESMGFSSGDIDKVVEKKAASKKETYESGEGEVESYTPDRTEDHDEIVIRLKDGRRVRISNNTRLGKLLRVKSGSRVGYHGYRVGGTNVVHKVHPNRRSRGGWLERLH